MNLKFQRSHRLFAGDIARAKSAASVCDGRKQLPLFGAAATQEAGGAFTLIEIMIVVCIMGVVLTMGVPMVYKILHRAPMSQAVRDVVEVCSNARRFAIMQGRQVDVIFHPREGRFEVGASATPSRNTQSGPAAPAPPGDLPAGLPTTSGVELSKHLPDGVTIELMDINKLPHEFRDDEIAHVRFFPNGTCDELTLILVSIQNERREITLEITTSLANVESDPRRFK